MLEAALTLEEWRREVKAALEVCMESSAVDLIMATEDLKKTAREMDAMAVDPSS